MTERAFAPDPKQWCDMGELVSFPHTPQVKASKDAKLTVATDGIELLAVFVTVADPVERRRIIEFARIVALKNHVK